MREIHQSRQVKNHERVQKDIVTRPAYWGFLWDLGHVKAWESDWGGKLFYENKIVKARTLRNKKQLYWMLKSSGD